MGTLRERRAAIGALLALCLIWAAGSLRADLLPGSSQGFEMSPLALEALLLGLFAVLSGVVGLASKSSWPRGRALVGATLAASGIFAIPALLVALGKGLIDAETRVALFSLVPVFAVVFEPHLNLSETEQEAPTPRGGLMAALAAVLGTLLVFPVDIPQTVTSGLAFAGIIVSAAAIAAGNCMGTAVCRQREISGLGFGAQAAAIGALALGVAGLVLGRNDTSGIRLDAWALPELIALALLFWLLPRMSAVRMSTRFLIAPLLANLIGLAFLRPGVQWRGWLGLLLIALGSGWLLLGPDAQNDASTLKLDLT